MRIGSIKEWRGKSFARDLHAWHLINAGLCAITVSGCAQFMTDMPIQKRSVSHHVPLPNNSLLKSPNVPNCSTDASGPSSPSRSVGTSASVKPHSEPEQETESSDLAERTKLEFERDCYRDDAGSVRKQLTKLQSAVRNTARAVRRMDAAKKVARARQGSVNQ